MPVPDRGKNPPPTPHCKIKSAPETGTLQNYLLIMNKRELIA